MTNYTSELLSAPGEAQTIVNTALRAAPPAELIPGKVYAFHTTAGIHQVDLTGDQYASAPKRKAGTTTVRDAPSFLAYYAKHSDDASEVYADSERLTITAVLDAHTTDEARWSGHLLRLALRKTEAWEQWTANDGRLMKQDTFAEFLQDHVPELLEPAGAEMLEIAQSIQAATKVDFQSTTRLSDGRRQFQYVETSTAKAGQKGQLEIPETFKIGVVPFEGSEGYELMARFRYRISQNGELTMAYKLERPGDTLKAAFADVVNAIDGEVTVPVLNGTPA